MPETIDNQNILYAAVRSARTSGISPRSAGKPQSVRRKAKPLEIIAVSVPPPADHDARVEWAMEFLARCLAEAAIASSPVEGRRNAA